MLQNIGSAADLSILSTSPQNGCQKSQINKIVSQSWKISLLVCNSVVDKLLETLVKVIIGSVFSKVFLTNC